MKSLEIITLIYKSTDYLDLIVSEFKKDYCKVDGWDIRYKIIANDPTIEVINHLPSTGIDYIIYNDPKPNDYYLNRVYRAWNYGGFNSPCENFCFVNSDMIFSENWLTNLLKHHDGNNIPCSRLVESGKLGTAPDRHGVIYNLGTNPKNIDYDIWYKLSNTIKEDRIERSGLLMPSLFSTSLFKESGGFPEGNIYSDGKAGSMVGNVVLPGDVYYFSKLEKEYNMKHVTVFDSLVYHIQEGEKDE
jgi:hypothetical protein